MLIFYSNETSIVTYEYWNGVLIKRARVCHVGWQRNGLQITGGTPGPFGTNSAFWWLFFWAASNPPPHHHHHHLYSLPTFFQSLMASYLFNCSSFFFFFFFFFLQFLYFSFFRCSISCSSVKPLSRDANLSKGSTIVCAEASETFEVEKLTCLFLLSLYTEHLLLLLFFFYFFFFTEISNLIFFFFFEQFDVEPSAPHLQDAPSEKYDLHRGFSFEFDPRVSPPHRFDLQREREGNCNAHEERKKEERPQKGN